MNEWDIVRVTGNIVSEEGEPFVKDLIGTVATNNPYEDYFKLWPHIDDDPQLPKDHDGKLWFQRSKTEVKIIEPGFPEEENQDD